MNKKNLMMFLGIIMFLAACSTEDVVYKKPSKGEIDIHKDVTKITVSGPMRLFTDTKEHQQNEEVYLEDPEEIEVILKAIEGSSPPSGALTDEGANFKIILSYKDNTSESFLWWFNPESSFGKIQNESANGPRQILKKEDVKNMMKLLEKKVKYKKEYAY